MRFRTYLPPLLLGFALILSSCREQPQYLMRVYMTSGEGDLGKISVPVIMPISGIEHQVYSQPVLFEGDFVDVDLVQSDFGMGIYLKTTGRAQRSVYRATVANRGKHFVLFLNDRAIGTRLIDTPIENGVIGMFLEISDDQLPDLVRDLKQSIKRAQELKK